jgi:hypothetical protein
MGSILDAPVMIGKRNLFWKSGQKHIYPDVKDVKNVREIERIGWFYKELQK